MNKETTKDEQKVGRPAQASGGKYSEGNRDQGSKKLDRSGPILVGSVEEFPGQEVTPERGARDCTEPISRS
jgi:hypothetical protein